MGRQIECYEKVGQGAGEVITTIHIGTGLWELIAASVKNSMGYPNPCVLVYGYKDGNTTRYSHLKSGYSTSKVPLCLDTPRTIEGPGAVACVVQHASTEEHLLTVSIRRAYE